MQAIVAWRAPGGVLGELVAEARGRAAALRARDAELHRAAADAPPPVRGRIYAISVGQGAPVPHPGAAGPTEIE